VYDPDVISYPALLQAYAGWHTPRRSVGQYRSIVFADGHAQHEALAELLKGRWANTTPETIDSGTPEGRFWDAEAYHQKYWLRRNDTLVRLLAAELGPRWDESTVATKLNAALRGTVDAEQWLSLLSDQTQRAYRTG
jgi:peptide-methionine (S)-S-oxide reductase